MLLLFNAFRLQQVSRLGGGILHLRSVVISTCNGLAAKQAQRLQVQLGQKGQGYDHYYRQYYKTTKRTLYWASLLAIMIAVTVATYYLAGKWYFVAPYIITGLPFGLTVGNLLDVLNIGRLERKRRPAYYDPFGRR